MRFDVGACVDLGAFDPGLDDCGLERFLAAAGRLPAWLCLMEDRQPDFFVEYRGFVADAVVPLNRQGPSSASWTHADLRRFVAAAKAQGVPVLLGVWIHECAFVERHPELYMTRADGTVWSDPAARSADFNPMKRMRADAKGEIEEGTRFVDFMVSQYAKLAHDFGFAGLFVGDGGMGFREFSDDDRGSGWFDFDPAWVREFAPQASAHAGCALDSSDPRLLARDVREHHWAEWLAWTCDRWTAFYGTLAAAVHRRGGILGAYNVMNFDPVEAYLHGADYRAIARAGLDLLVFQTYDYAWGPRGPFKPERKDVATNLRAIMRTKAYLRGERTRVIFTAGAGDSVEGWHPPLAHAVGEAHLYASARVSDGSDTRRAADGAFVVWGNSATAETWRAFAGAFASPTTLALESAEAWDDDAIGTCRSLPALRALTALREAAPRPALATRLEVARPPGVIAEATTLSRSPARAT